MQISVKQISISDASQLLSLDESHFLDFKSKRAAPSKLNRTLSAFANTGGGELIVGVEETTREPSIIREWAGFSNQEEANGIFQVVAAMDPMGTTL